MSENCYHYSAYQTEDKRLYCYKCKEFLTRSLQWRGTLRVGRFEASFDQVTPTLDWTTLIEEFTGHKIVIQNVISTVTDSAYGSDDVSHVIYTVKGAHDSNIATIILRCDRNYTGTGEFYKEQEEPVEA